MRTRSVRQAAFCLGLTLGVEPIAAFTQPTPRAPQSPQAFQAREEWRRGALGTTIGREGLAVADIDGDGSQEIVVTGGGASLSGFWSILRQDAGGYVQDWISDVLPDGLTSLRVGQVDGDAPLEILVGSRGDILVFDGATRQLERIIPTGATDVLGLTVVDVDSDGQLELVFCDIHSLYVFDLATGVVEYAGFGYGGDDLAVGNVDDDAALEIVVTDSFGPGYVVDGQSHAVEWNNPSGFGFFVALGDLDGDGREELVSAFIDVTIYDVELHSLKATIPGHFGVDALEVLDVEGDGPLEIVIGQDQFGSIDVHNGQTYALKWSVPNPDHGVANLAFGDPDGDGTRELVWGAGYSSSGPDHVFVADSVTQALEWKSLDLGGPFYAMSHGDVDADGQPEILYASLESENFDPAWWFVHDASTHVLEYQGSTSSGVPGEVWRMGNADVDADPQQEILVGKGDQLFCHDGLTAAEQWRADLPLSMDLHALALADVDLDGAIEAVVAGETPFHGTFAVVIDAASGGIEWQSQEQAPSSFADAPLLRVANVDSDPNPEIVLAEYLGKVFAIDGVTHAVTDLGHHDTTALDTPDRDGDGVAEIVVGTDSGEIQVVGAGGTVVETVAAYGTRIDGLQVRDVTGDGTADYVLSTANEVLIRNGATGQTDWSSGQLLPFFGSAGLVGARDSLRLADVDQDGRLEIVVNMGYIGFRVYEIPPAADVWVTIDDAPDPVLVGDDVTYTLTVANAAALGVDGVVVTETLASGLAFVSSTPGPPVCTAAAQTVTCELGSLGAGASALVTVTAQATVAGTLTSQASVATDHPDPVPANNTESETTTVTQTLEADLAMGVDDGQFVAAPGQPLSYLLTVANLGPWPVSEVNVIDTVPPELLNPVFTPLVGTYDSGTGAWTGLNLSAGSSVQMTLDATLDPAATGLLTNAAVVAPPAGVLDVVPANNDGLDTDVVGTGLRELDHGASLERPEWIAGRAFYRIRQQRYSSYEVVVEATSGDVAGGSPVLLRRLAPDLETVLSGSAPLGAGFSRSLRFENRSGQVQDGEVVEVQSTGCGAACGPDDAYRLRAYDTTCTISRFNNSASQLTVVVLENTTDSAVSGVLWFWSSAGALLASRDLGLLAPHAVVAVNTSSIPGLVGQSGSVTVSHDAPYGGLQGKAVAVEPATGFTFDSPLTPRPR